MASHACWVAALAVSVATGRQYASDSLGEFGGIGGLCDAAFVNGNNGPFGYGQNSGAERAINWILVAGGCIAVGLTLWSRRLRDLRVAMINLVLGASGGVIVLGSTVGQHEANPYCTDLGWLAEAVAALVLLVLASMANSFVRHRSSNVPPTIGGPVNEDGGTASIR